MRVVDCDSEEHEAERVVARIQSLRAEGSLQPEGSQYREWKDFACCTGPTTWPSRLRKPARPIFVRIGGGQSFSAEIKDLCSWMVLISNNDNNAASIRAIKTPKRGIGHTTGALATFGDTYKLSLFESLFSNCWVRCCLQGGRLTARVWPLSERPRIPRQAHRGCRRCTGFLTDWLKEIDYEKASLRRRRQRKRGGGALVKCDGILRLDVAALRRPD